jgi:hypothetical protein
VRGFIRGGVEGSRRIGRGELLAWLFVYLIDFFWTEKERRKRKKKRYMYE